MRQRPRAGWLKQAVIWLALLVPFAGAANEWLPSEMAKDGFRSDAGFSFRVNLKDGWPTVQRTSYYFDPAAIRELPPAYRGAAAPVLTVVFDASKPNLVAVEEPAWDYKRAMYGLPDGGQATLTFSRLSPAVLLDSPAKAVTFEPPRTSLRGVEGARLKYVAFVSGGKLLCYQTAELAKPLDGLALTEPWILAWFGRNTQIRGYEKPFDVGDVTGVDKPKLAAGEFDPLDLPILFRLEHKPDAVRASDTGALTFSFANSVGKIAVMPLMGAKVVLPAETETWIAGLPQEVLQQCRLWSRRLRDYPVTVIETFLADPAQDTLAIQQRFQWASFEDDWETPEVKSAPVPPMLALALGGGVPVAFYVQGKQVAPTDYNLMDTPGKAMGIEGADSYEYRITGLSKYLWYKRDRSTVAPEAKPLAAKLEKHVQEMVDAGHLAPLFYIYGGIGGTWFAHYYWVGSPELAHALTMAYPYLSPGLQERVKQYLKAEWQAYPPFQINDSYYDQGVLRTPYEIPWQDIGQNMARPKSRDLIYRRNNFLFDLYRANEYYELVEPPSDEAKLRETAVGLAKPLLARQDWAIMGPDRLTTVTEKQSLRYFTLQGQATYNTWLAGAMGLARLARRLGWESEEELGWYLFGKLALARIGQARYVAEMHRMGLVRGDEKEDWRTLLHIDTSCALVGWGSLTTTVFQDQEFPPFIDLVEEVGLLLHDYAQDECETYLDYLDRWVPYWYLSEAPKQSATEHRTCPLQHLNGNVLAQHWILGKRGKDFARYVDTTRFKGDLYYLQNMAVAIDSFAGPVEH